MKQSEVFDLLQKAGIVAVEVHFSGGNDSGGHDSITYFNEYVKPSRKNGWSGPRNEIEDVPDYVVELEDTLVDPIYEKYCSFAGEFSVNGILTWNVVEKTVVMNGQETTEIDISEDLTAEG